ncbi:unnamed protein product [Prorocentrum cordatum]|uniref:Cupin-like domain-containing protein n=1 Tax=Prorocentrum cordatum TaxID=2364126 RepID=A0ABN9VAK0_9DINO|nr:unnamed protein product [Polarella glacialis]
MGPRRHRGAAGGQGSGSAPRRRAAEAAGPAGAGLRAGYRGYCPLGGLGDSGGPGVGAAAPLEVERRACGSMEAAAFFDGFVKARRPLVLDGWEARGGPLRALFGLRGGAARWGGGGPDALAALAEGPAGACAVVVEQRADAAAPFGRQDAGRRRETTLAEFCRELQTPEGELGYLTTQRLPEDEDGCATALAAPFLLHLLRGARRLRPQLVGALAPVQYNLWLGRAAEGSTSGLHHDFHDNLYVVLRGEKEFRLFSPRCVDLLAPAGAGRGAGPPLLRSNGLIPSLASATTAPPRPWCRSGGGAGAARWRPAPAAERPRTSRTRRRTWRGRCRRPGRAGQLGRGGGRGRARAPRAPGSRTASARSAPPRGQEVTLDFHLCQIFSGAVTSQRGTCGHLALNLWMAPPDAGGNFEQPYEDGFWEAKYQAMRRAFRAGGGARGARRKRPRARQMAELEEARARLEQLRRRRSDEPKRRRAESAGAHYSGGVDQVTYTAFRATAIACDPSDGLRMFHT